MARKGYDYKQIYKKEDAPQAPHFAALVFTSYRYDSGYDDGPSTASKVDYLSFPSREAMEDWVIQQETKTGTREPYQILEVMPRTVQLVASVAIQ